MSLTTSPISSPVAAGPAAPAAETSSVLESTRLGFDMSDQAGHPDFRPQVRAAEAGCLAGPKLAGPAWREASRFIEASPAQIMAAAEARIRSTANQGRRPVVVVDLDSTVYDNGPRTAHLARRFAEANSSDPVFGKEAAKMAKFAPRNATFSFEDMARSAGVAVETPEGKTAVGAFTKFWLSGFFNDSLVPLDQPYPGAVSAVQRLLDAAPEAPPELQPMVVFLTGRHRAFVPDQEKDNHLRDGMERGTRAALKRDGLPADPPRALLMMKDSFREPDSDFKGRVREQINRLGTVVATFDNEPANVAEFVAGYPAMHVYVHTIDSGKEAQPVRGVYKMGPGDNSSAHWPS